MLLIILKVLFKLVWLCEWVSWTTVLGFCDDVGKVFCDDGWSIEFQVHSSCHKRDLGNLLEGECEYLVVVSSFHRNIRMGWSLSTDY